MFDLVEVKQNLITTIALVGGIALLVLMLWVAAGRCFGSLAWRRRPLVEQLRAAGPAMAELSDARLNELWVDPVNRAPLKRLLKIDRAQRFWAGGDALLLAFGFGIGGLALTTFGLVRVL